MQNTTKHQHEMLCSSPITVTHYLCPIYPNKSNDCHSHSLIFTVILANKIFIITPLQCSTSLRVGWTEEKSPKWSYSIAMYLNKYLNTLLKMKTTELCMKLIMYSFLKLWRAGKHSEGKLKHDDLCDTDFVNSGYNTMVCGIRIMSHHILSAEPRWGLGVLWCDTVFLGWVGSYVSL
jgi:hypothetical protein